MTEHEQIIRDLLARYAPGDVKGYARKNHGVLVTYDEVVAVYNQISDETGRRRLLKGRVPQPVPQDFAEHASERNVALMERYGVKVETIIRWRNEAGLPAEHVTPKSPPKLPIPRDLAANARVMTQRKLAEHYGRSVGMIREWLKRIDCRAKPSAASAPTWTNNLGSMTKAFDARENSEAGRAAKFMQKFWSTFRSDVRGNPMPDGFFWNCGGKVMTDGEMIKAAGEKRERDARLLRARAA